MTDWCFLAFPEPEMVVRILADELHAENQMKLNQYRG